MGEYADDEIERGMDEWMDERLDDGFDDDESGEDYHPLIKQCEKELIVPEKLFCENCNKQQKVYKMHFETRTNGDEIYHHCCEVCSYTLAETTVSQKDL